MTALLVLLLQLAPAPCPPAWSVEGRVIPHYRGGVADGFKVVGLPPDGRLAALGLRSGDALRALDGHPIDTAAAAAEAIIAIAAGVPLTLVFERRGAGLVVTRPQGEVPAAWFSEPPPCPPNSATIPAHVRDHLR